MAKKIIYFTAGDVPTTEEKAEIDALNAFAVAPFELVVRNGAAMSASPAPHEACDYVAGTPPTNVPAGATQYNDMDVFDPDAPPASALPAGVGIVADGQEFAATGGTVTISVADGVVTAEFTPDP